ncbi:symplekin isoform X1, partial [Tanacetum coccineum]
DHLMDKAHTDGSNAEVAKDNEMGNPLTESVSAIVKDSSSEAGQASTSDNNPSTSIIDAQRCMSLYFALCTKKHSLFRQLLIVYKNMSKAAKQAISVQIPKLVRTIGSSPQLLEIIADPPAGSETLLMQVVQTLTDGALPSPNLIATIKKLYDTKLRDTEILIPILPFLPKDELLQIFPRFVNLPSDKFQAALARILQESSQGGSILTPAEVLIGIHGIDLEKDGIPLKKANSSSDAVYADSNTDNWCISGAGGFYNGDSVSSCKQTDLEKPKGVGRILKMCSANKASIFRCATSGVPFDFLFYD